MFILRSIALLQLLILTSCSAYQNLTIHDIRTKKHFAGSYEVDKSIKDIQNSIYQYSSSCRPHPFILINPQDPTAGIITFSGPGLTENSVVAVVDFKQTSNARTQIDAYFYYPYAKHLAERIIQIITQPNYCD